MRHPQMSRQPHRSVRIPALIGGVNVHDTPDAVQDNQITDCVNMWNDGNLVSTRPGITKVAETDAENGFQILDERSAIITHSYTNEYLDYAIWWAKHISVDNVGYVNDLLQGQISYYAKKDGNQAPKSLVVRKGRKWYAFLSGGEIITPVDESWEEAEPYVPLIMVNGKGFANFAESAGVRGAAYEPFNMLTNKFRCRYSTYRQEAAVTPTGWSRFFLPHTNIIGNTHIALTLYSETLNKVRTFEWDIDQYTGVGHWELPTGATDDDFPNGDDGNGYYYDMPYFLFPEEQAGTYSKCKLVAKAFPSGEVRVYFNYNSIEDSYGYIPTVTDNNLEITAELNGNDEHKKTICNMTKCTWFGGDRSGVAGGTRLFVTGNPEKPNLVHWSSLNDPTYFPENNYAYIGDELSPVTAFGKQADMLVMFKEREMYCAQYVANTVSGDDLQNGVDLEAAIAKFPIMPISSTIGCDCPNTVRLVNNRLVWATSDGNVYILTAASQYGERNVRLASLTIDKLLVRHTKEELINASAAEYETHYILNVGNKAYVLDSDNSAFVSFSYYANDRRAQTLMQWFEWEYGEYNVFASVGNGKDVLVCFKNGQKIDVYKLGGDTDDGEPIPFRFTTKHFDFGAIDRRKEINQIYIGILSSLDADIHFDYHNGANVREDAYTIGGDGAGEIVTKRLTPNVNRAKTFALTVHGTGNVGIGNIEIKYAHQGVIR